MPPSISNPNLLQSTSGLRHQPLNSRMTLGPPPHLVAEHRSDASRGRGTTLDSSFAKACFRSGRGYFASGLGADFAGLWKPFGGPPFTFLLHLRSVRRKRDVHLWWTCVSVGHLLGDLASLHVIVWVVLDCVVTPRIGQLDEVGLSDVVTIRRQFTAKHVSDEALHVFG